MGRGVKNDERSDVTVEAPASTSADVPLDVTSVGDFDYDRARHAWTIKESAKAAQGLPHIVLSNAPIELVQLFSDLMSLSTGGDSFRSFLLAHQLVNPDQPRVANPDFGNFDSHPDEPEYLYPGDVSVSGDYRYDDYAEVSIHLDFLLFDAEVGGFVPKAGASTVEVSSLAGSTALAGGFTELIRNRYLADINSDAYDGDPSDRDYDVDPRAWADMSAFINLAVPVSLDNYLQFAKPNATPFSFDVSSSSGGVDQVYVDYRGLNDSFFQALGYKDGLSYMASNLIHEIAGHGGFKEDNRLNGHGSVLTNLLSSTSSGGIALLDSMGKFNAASLSGLVDISTDPVETFVFNAMRDAQLFSGNPADSTYGDQYRNTRNQTYIKLVGDEVTRLNNTINPATGVKYNITTVADLINAANNGLLNSAVSKLFAKPRVDSDGNFLVDLYNIGESFVDGVVTGLESLDGGQLGIALGSALGRRITDDTFGQIGASAALKTTLGALGEFIDVELFGTPQKITLPNGEQVDNPALSTDFLGNGLEGFFQKLGQNVVSSGVGALSSYLTAQLFDAVGVNGFVGGLLQSAGGAVINQVLSNIASQAQLFGAEKAGKIFEGINGDLLASAAASFIGRKLANEIYTPSTIGGQIGSAVGSAFGGFAAGKVLAASGLNPVSFAAAVAVVAIFQLGGALIGSLFGGTPRSGADAQWDEASGEFVVANGYSRKGGSKEEAEALASTVANNLNAVLQISDARLLDPGAIQAGNYGKRKSTFVYRPISTRDKRAISARFKGDSGAVDLVSHGTYIGLNDLATQLVGGDIYVKRALLSSLSNAGGNPNSNAEGASGDFSIEELFGDLSIAQDYSLFVDEYRTIGSILAKGPESAFAASWLATLARASELDLNKRAVTDWTGGFSAFLDEIGDNTIDGEVSSAANVQAYIDPVSRLRSWRLFSSAGTYLGYSADTILPSDITTIERPADEVSNDVIDLRSGQLADQSGFVVNGVLRDDITDGASDYSAYQGFASVTGSNIRNGYAITVSAAANTAGEANESFRYALSDGVGSYLMRGEADVTIVDAADKAHLMVGRAYGTEAEGYLVWRVSLSKAATDTVTLDLALSPDGAAAVADYIDTIQISAGQVGPWTNTSQITLAAGVTEYFVRVATTSSPEVEGNERLILSATATSGSEHLENGEQTVSGIGTIVDGSQTDPLVWADDLIVHAGGSGVLSLARSRAEGNSGVTVSAHDNHLLDIPVAATVDAGAGDDVVHASDLGDNIFGGDGNDTLYGGRLDDWLLGGDGNDTIDARAQNGGLGGDGNYLDGGAGNDTLIGREGSDWLEGGDGVDDLSGGGGDDILTGGAGANDELFGGTGDDTYLLRLGDGADIVTELDPTLPEFRDDAFLTRDLLNDPYLDSLSLSLRSDITARFDAVAQMANSQLGTFVTSQYSATYGRDWLGYYTPGVSNRSLGGGEDSVVLGQGIAVGDIRLTPTNGNADLMIEIIASDGQPTGDSLTLQNWFANPFDRIEWLKFADGNEIRIGDLTSFVIGNDSNNTLIGTLGNDFVFGAGGDDTLFLLAGNDIGNGGTGGDFISGDSGNDLIVGGSGDDTITGEAGADTLSGDGGVDQIYGGDGSDLISGGRGDDWLAGGRGDDIFKYNRGDGQDTVVDEINGNWLTIWDQDDQWADGYTELSDGTITGPGGVVLRENVGTADAPVLRWNGRFEFQSDASPPLLRYFEPASSGSVAQNNGTDTIEFGPSIHVQDLVLENRGTDLIVHISSDQGASGSFSSNDSLTLTDWNNGAGGSIERFAFFSTGILDLAATNIVAGTEGNDTALTGLSTQANWITGGAGDDQITGGNQIDILAGNGGIDTISAGGGDDILYGGGGDDILIGGAGDDLLVGGAGSDWASYESSTIGLEISLGQPGLNTGEAKDDSYSSIENLRGTQHDDILKADAGDNILDGNGGTDTLSGGAGDDTYIFAAAASGVTSIGVIQEGDVEFQEIFDANGTSAPGVTVFTDTYEEEDEDTGDTTTFYVREVTAANGNPVYSYDGEDSSVLSSNPSSWPSADNEWYDGFGPTGVGNQVGREVIGSSADAGTDTIELGQNVHFANLTFALAGPDLTLSQSPSSSITIRSQQTVGGKVEFLQFHDGLVARLDNLKLGAAGGSDDDLIIGTSAADSLNGNSGDDVVFGGAGNDTLSGNAGDDVIEGGAGADVLDGGANSLAADNPTGWGDTVRYVGSSEAVVVDFLSGNHSGGDAAGDILSGFENIEGSWGFGDWLRGDGNANKIFGHGGADTIYGLAGDDVIVGGEDDDTLYGDGGEDNLSGGSGDDAIYGGSENDLIDGGAGHDRLEGGDGDDILLGGDGNERTFGAYSGHIWGGRGDDLLDGGAGVDDLRGGEDNDTLIGGTGDDVLYGDEGDDLFLFGRNDGADVLLDQYGTNTIAFTDGITRDQLWITNSGADIYVAVIGGDTNLRINGVSQIDRIQTADGTLFLSETAADDLISAMTQASASAPAEIPSDIAEQIDVAWSSTETPAPRAPDDRAPVQITTLSANAFNNDQWPDLASTGKAEENLVNEDAWPRDIDAPPAAGSLGAGWSSSYLGETAWSNTLAPYARSLTTYLADDRVVSLHAGQEGLAGVLGGGAQSDPFTIDKSKTYEFSIYFKVDALDKHPIFFGLGGDVEWGRNLGVDNDNPYFLSSNNKPSAANGYEENTWYKFVGYVLPDGSVQESLDAYGGIYSTVTGEKVQDVEHFVWDGARSSTTSNFRFFNFNDESVTGKHTHFFQPQVREVVDTRYMLRSGDRLNTWQDSKFVGSTYVEGNLPVAPYDQDGESRWTEVIGPDGTPTVVLETGEFDGSPDGGGHFTNNVTIDRSKTYRYVQYFRKSDLLHQSVTMGVLASSAEMKRVSSGLETQYGYSVNLGTTQQQQQLDEDEWYMAVGYFFANGALPTDAATHGGIFRVSDGVRVGDVENHQWKPGTGSFTAQGLFFNHAGGTERGWTTQFGAPTFGVIDDADLASYEADPFGQFSTWYGETVDINAALDVTDVDDATLTWALNPDGRPEKGELISIDETTGMVEYRPYADALGTDSFSVIAIDAAGNQTVVPIDVELTLGNVNQAPIVPLEGYAFELAENSVYDSQNAVLVGQVTATDDPEEYVEYLFDKSLMVTMGGIDWTFSSDGRFKMMRHTGHVTLNEGDFSYDYESGVSEFNYDLRIRNRFGSTDSRSAYSTLTITVGDVNEMHTMSAATIDVAYFDKALGPLVPIPDLDGFAINLVELMLDDPEGQTLSWSLVNPHPAWSLAADGTLHQVDTVTASTAGSPSVYSLTVRATDSDGNFADAALTINVGEDDGTADNIRRIIIPDYDFDDLLRGIDGVLPPVVLDLDGDGVELLSINAGVRFDMDANGTLDRTGWFGADDGVLAFDENGNGLIDNGDEINFQRFVEGAFSDLEGLTFFDTNANGLFDTGDAQWGEFFVWQDANSDGVSQDGELRRLDEVGIVSINLSGEETGQMPDGSDNVLYATSTFDRTDGSSGQVGDVFFVFDPATEQTPVPDPVVPETPAGPGVANPDTHESNLPALEFGHMTYGVKSKRYRLSTRNGSLFIGPRGSDQMIDQRAGQLSGSMMFEFRNRTFGVLNAVVLDLDNDGIETRRYKKTRAAFDMDGNGSRDNVGWTTSNDGFLVIDRNGNGVIDDATEMAFLDSDGVLRNGQAGLRALDSNGDGVVTVDDELFSSLQVWVDADRDGLTDAGEMQLLSARGIESIGLGFAAVEETKRFGRNLTLGTTVFTRTDGSTGTAGDIAFTFVPAATPISETTAVPSQHSDFADGLEQLSGLSLDQLSIEELLDKWAGGNGRRERLETFIGSTGGEFPLPVLEARIVEEASGENDLAAPANEAHIDPQTQTEAALAARLALLRQDLAAFGSERHADDLGDPRDRMYTPLDYFA